MRDTQENAILSVLQENKSCTVGYLAETLDVSPSTVRRKLTDLQKKGLVLRTHGGAEISVENTVSPNFDYRTHQNGFLKKKIALSAMRFIKDGDVVFLDGSTSAFYLAEYVSEFPNVKVITCGIDTLSRLSAGGVKAYSTGGVVSESNRSVLVGHFAEDMIKSLHADVAFLSSHSVDKDGNVYDCFEEENVLRRQMMKNATKKIFLCDSTKFGWTSPFHLCKLDDFDLVVTDKDVKSLLGDCALPEIVFD